MKAYMKFTPNGDIDGVMLFEVAEQPPGDDWMELRRVNPTWLQTQLTPLHGHFVLDDENLRQLVLASHRMGEYDVRYQQRIGVGLLTVAGLAARGL